MRKTVPASAGFLLGALCIPAHANTIFVYRGHVLKSESGSGVQGVRALRFTLSGHAPPPGKCRRDLAILSLSDGNFSLKKALAQGYKETSDSRATVCSDAATGQFREKLYVNVVYGSGSNLQAGYTWQSFDPQRNKNADTVTSYENIEYHVSGTTRAGTLSNYKSN
jgi:hypothetical protein